MFLAIVSYLSTQNSYTKIEFKEAHGSILLGQTKVEETG